MKTAISALVACGVLSGCVTLSKQPEPSYVEPDPKLMPTARLRVVVAPGVSADVALYKNNADGICLRDNEPAYLPVDINISGFPQSHTKKIGMPLGNTYRGKIGTEMYIPVSKPITIGAKFSGNGGGFYWMCESAFRFQPMEGKDYQIYVIPGNGGTPKAPGCLIEIGEIPENHPADKALLSVETQQIIVKASPVWKQACTAGQIGP